uniref:EF-hand domain-containing protein n=1 Tax=Parastrongyloides trichosuri TaxID=131310 RepID=A0A0N4Z1E3_PARTI
MKTTFSGVAALALALAVGGGAMAQASGQVPARPQAPDARPHHAQMAEPVSQADFVQRRVQRLRAADANSDGQVTAEEMRAYAQARRAERQGARFDRLDANKDGVLDRDEFNTPRARGERGEGMGGRHGGGRNDRGGHGGANRHGMARGGESRFPIVIADVERRANEAFARMDANRDGVLTQDERRAAMRANRADMRQRHEQRRARTPAASPSAPASE